jgi:hypothetical protein
LRRDRGAPQALTSTPRRVRMAGRSRRCAVRTSIALSVRS